MFIEFLVFRIFISALGIGLFVWAILSFRKKRLIENTPTSKIRSIAMGLVEIFGEVVPTKNNILKSPFSQNDCVYYRYKIEEYRSSGKSSHWVTIRKGTNHVYFYLKDETGMVLINPQDAKIDIPADNVFKSSMGKDPSYKVQEFLQKENVKFEGSLLGINKTMRYTEHFIEPKDNLYIMGTAADNPFVEDASAFKGVEDVIIKKGKHEKIYYISDRSERMILRRLNIIVFCGLVFGSLLIILGLISFIW
jgi:hypothetical protein